MNFLNDEKETNAGSSMSKCKSPVSTIKSVRKSAKKES